MEENGGSRQEHLHKDAFDIYQLLRATETTELAEEFGILQSNGISSRVTLEALSMFQDLFGSRSGMGTTLLVGSVGALEDPAFIVDSSVALSQDLLKATAQ